jgi:hypothetical protein
MCPKCAHSPHATYRGEVVVVGGKQRLFYLQVPAPCRERGCKCSGASPTVIQPAPAGLSSGERRRKCT